jgi:glycosyltransferase involved in cell wall biosynthesis
VGYVRNLRAWGTVAVDAAGPVDAWHVHDLPGLAAIAPRVGRGVPVVYDSHEIFLEAGTASRLPGPVRTLLRAYERRLVRRIAALVAVNDAIARELGERYGPVRTITVHNCPPRWSGPGDGTDRMRTALGLPPDTPIVLCHGSLGAGRGLEETIEAMARLGDLPAHLVFLGFGPSLDRYRAMAAAAGIGDRLHLLEPVEPGAVLEWISTADVDVMVIQPTELNAMVSTPNKLFESLAAGVPVVSSDFPLRRRILVEDPDGPLGAVCDPRDPDAVAAAIRGILELDPAARAELRRRCRRAGQERWNWEAESAKLVALYADILPPGPPAAGPGESA